MWAVPLLVLNEVLYPQVRDSQCLEEVLYLLRPVVPSPALEGAVVPHPALDRVG